VAEPAQALLLDKKRTTVTLPLHLLDAAEALADKRNTTVSAIISQAVEAGLNSLLRKEKARQTYDRLHTALTGLTEAEQLLVDGIRLTPADEDRPGQ
jgi:predicted transcriptional regulator